MTNLLLAFAAEGEELVEFGQGGQLQEWAWLILVAPFIAYVLILAYGKKLKYEGGEIAVAMMAFVFGYGLLLWLDTIRNHTVFEKAIEIGRIGDGMVLEWGWVVDGLSSMMYFVVGTVGLLVFIYALGYMKGERRNTFFYASFSLFAGAMLVLVASANLAQLIVGWELVGVASYLLIGHYWEDKANSSAGMKAFFTNKVADVGLIIGALALSVSVGSFRIKDILDVATHQGDALGAPFFGSTVAVAGALLLFFGAMGKSAQFPLHIWLPDAMAGPTPVSALMHAATMVTAGIYLMARMFPLYQEMATAARPIMIAVGAATLFLTGLIALVQDDIKKVLAYSTVSQLGYMMVAIAAGGYTAAVFHLFTHAFFKALLFLGAGSVIHGVHSNNMSDMGGLRKYMPRTFWTFIIGSGALAGIIPLAGFFSKDEILGTLDYGGYTAVLWIAIAGAFVTAFYMTRAVALTFFGEYKGHGHPHESEGLMTVPLMVLAFFSIVAGFVNMPGFKFGESIVLRYTGFTEWLATRDFSPLGDHHPESLEWSLALFGTIAAVGGIALGWMFFGKDAETQQERDTVSIPVLYPLLRAKYYLDDVALALVGVIKGPAARFVDWTNTYVFDTVVNSFGFAAGWLGKFVYNVADQGVIDGVFNGSAGIASAAGGWLRKIQTGKIQQYAGALVVGAVALVVGFVLFNIN